MKTVKNASFREIKYLPNGFEECASFCPIIKKSARQIVSRKVIVTPLISKKAPEFINPTLSP